MGSTTLPVVPSREGPKRPHRLEAAKGERARKLANRSLRKQEEAGATPGYVCLFYSTPLAPHFRYTTGERRPSNLGLCYLFMNAGPPALDSPAGSNALIRAQHLQDRQGHV